MIILCNGEIEEDGKKWRLVSPRALAHWKRRGFKNDNLTEEESKCLIRVNGSDGDDTNGFFVSYFERTGSVDFMEVDDSSLINVFEGVKGVYNGEFRQIAIPVPAKKQIAPSNNNSKEEVEQQKTPKAAAKKTKATKNIIQKKGAKQEESKAAPKQAKETKNIPKKAAKKLDWKNKQREKKLDRVKRQKAEGNKKVKVPAVDKPK